MSKLKEALSLFDVPADLVEGFEKGEKTLDDLKGYTQANFINRNMALEDKELRTKFAGRVLGGVTTYLKSEGGFQNADVEGKKPEEIFAMYKSKVEAKITELESASGQGKDEAIKAWEEKYKKAEKERNDYKTMSEANLNGWNEEKANAAQKIKSFKLGNIVSGTKSKIPFKDGISDIEKEGFESYLAKNYKFDLSDSDEIEIYDPKGERVKTETGNGFMGLEDLIKSEAKKNNLLKLNNSQGGAPAPAASFSANPAAQPNPQAERLAHLASLRKR